MRHLVIGQRQKASNFSAFHWSPHGCLITIGQHFVTTRVVHLPKRAETSLITESDQSRANHKIIAAMHGPHSLVRFGPGVRAVHSCESWFDYWLTHLTRGTTPTCNFACFQRAVNWTIRFRYSSSFKFCCVFFFFFFFLRTNHNIYKGRARGNHGKPTCTFSADSQAIQSIFFLYLIDVPWVKINYAESQTLTAKHE